MFYGIVEITQRSRGFFGADINLKNTDNRTNNKRSHFRTIVVCHTNNNPNMRYMYPKTQKKGYTRHDISFCGYNRNGHFCPYHYST